MQAQAVSALGLDSGLCCVCVCAEGGGRVLDTRATWLRVTTWTQSTLVNERRDNDHFTVCVSAPESEAEPASVDGHTSRAANW